MTSDAPSQLPAEGRRGAPVAAAPGPAAVVGQLRTRAQLSPVLLSFSFSFSFSFSLSLSLSLSRSVCLSVGLSVCPYLGTPPPVALNAGASRYTREDGDNGSMPERCAQELAN